MLEIIAVIVVGKYFLQLAKKYQKNKWAYAILGVATFYGTTLISAILYVLVYFANDPLASEDDISPVLATIIGIALGAGTSFILYYFLEKNWRKNQAKERVNIDDIGKN